MGDVQSRSRDERESSLTNDEEESSPMHDAEEVRGGIQDVDEMRGGIQWATMEDPEGPGIDDDSETHKENQSKNQAAERLSGSGDTLANSTVSEKAEVKQKLAGAAAMQ